jgi:hypothetical protein
MRSSVGCLLGPPSSATAGDKRYACLAPVVNLGVVCAIYQLRPTDIPQGKLIATENEAAARAWATVRRIVESVLAMLRSRPAAFLPHPARSRGQGLAGAWNRATAYEATAAQLSTAARSSLAFSPAPRSMSARSACSTSPSSASNAASLPTSAATTVTLARNSSSGPFIALSSRSASSLVCSGPYKAQTATIRDHAWPRGWWPEEQQSRCRDGVRRRCLARCATRRRLTKHGTRPGYDRELSSRAPDA